MPKIAYVPKKFSAPVLAIIEQADQIVAEYRDQGFDLTLRQLFYQFVSRGLVPNSQAEYKRLGSIVNDARLAGLIDWKSIVDRTRFVRENSHWSNPQSILRSAAASFRLDKWKNQIFRPVVFIEKDALIGVIENVCKQLDIPYFACRGYVSQSEMWAAGERYVSWIKLGQMPYVIHLGDHDPSGIDMTRDIRERLEMFTGVGAVMVVRIALNMDQIEQYDPPPNPAKLTDSRCGSYVDKYGDNSWELDALDPSVINDLIKKEVDKIMVKDLWADVCAEEAKHVRWLEGLAESNEG